jgi:hypothetical protein
MPHSLTLARGSDQSTDNLSELKNSTAVIPFPAGQFLRGSRCIDEYNSMIWLEVW